MESPEQTAIAHCKTAMKYAKSFDVELNLNEHDISNIEMILEYYSKDLNPNFLGKLIRKFKNEEPTDSQIWSMATVWGTYLGEIIRKFCVNDYQWVYEDLFNQKPILHLKNHVNNRIFPIDKAYKRLKNGKEDSIISFYDFIKTDIP